MIDTSELNNGDVCSIWIQSDEESEASPIKRQARFSNGVFVLADGTIRGSSVVKYKLIKKVR